MMHFPCTWTVLTLVLTTVLGQQCGTGASIIVQSQQDVDLNLADCETFFGGLYITRNYSGTSLVISNVTRITSGIQVYSGDGNVPTRRTALSSITATGLQYLDVLELFDDYIDFTIVSFPHLIQADVRIMIQLSPAGGTLDFPTLVNTSTLTVIGSVTSMNFSSLTTVNTLSIHPKFFVFYDAQDDPASYPQLDVDFPVLQNCSSLKLMGNLKSIHMPELGMSQTTELGGVAQRGQITVFAVGTPLNVYLPKLFNATDIDIEGSITNILFPSLFDVDGEFILSCHLPMAVRMAPLRTARKITLNGNITSNDLTSLKDLGTLSIDSEKLMDCAPAKATWLALNGSDSNPGNFSCTSPQEKFVRDRARTRNLALGLGLGVPLALLLLGYLLWRRKGNAIAQKEASPGYDLLYLQDGNARSSAGPAEDVLPGYTAASGRSKADASNAQPLHRS